MELDKYSSVRKSSSMGEDLPYIPSLPKRGRENHLPIPLPPRPRSGVKPSSGITTSTTSPEPRPPTKATQAWGVTSSNRLVSSVALNLQCH